MVLYKKQYSKHFEGNEKLKNIPTINISEKTNYWQTYTFNKNNVQFIPIDKNVIYQRTSFLKVR